MQEANAFATVLNPFFAEVLKFGIEAFKFPVAIISLYRFTILLAVSALFRALKVIVPLVSFKYPKFIAKSCVAAVVISLTRWAEITAALFPQSRETDCLNLFHRRRFRP